MINYYCTPHQQFSIGRDSLKRLNRFLLICIFMLTMTACNSVSPVDPSTEPSTNLPTNPPANSANTTGSPSTSGDSDQNSESTASEAPPYFGTWVIKRHVPTPNVTALTLESINYYIGKEIIVNEKQIVTSKGTIENPIYEEIIKTNAYFYIDWRIQFSSLGVTDNTVTEFDVSNYQHETEDGIGSNFILTNDNRIYTIIAGGLFELGK